jgi:hypothetical protein
MDVVAAMFHTAENSAVLPPLPAGLLHRVSLYADDVVVFVRPNVEELAVVKGILGCFGEASGMRVNFQKSAATPIRCSEEVLEAITPSLECPIRDLPCTYLGLPLSLRKLRKKDLQLVLDKLARKLSFWKAKLLTKEGRVAFVQAVMTASVIYHLMALDVDPWFIKAVDRLRRDFHWAGKPDARGGCCLVAWDAICQPKSLGGLGFHDLRKLNAALRARWLWFQKSGTAKPWSGIEFSVMPESNAIFKASVQVTLGDGARTLFWEDPWIGGLQADAIAPDLVKLVRPSVRRTRTVQQGLQGAAWAMDIVGELSVNAVVQYLKLWGELQMTALRNGHDSIRWKWTADGVFSSRTAYTAFFIGRTTLPGAAQVWNAFAPFKVRFHAWLALRDRSWTADRLTRRGLSTHALCLLCGVAGETLDHLSLQCPFAINVWIATCQQHRLGILPPTPQSSLKTWWPAAVANMSKGDSKAANNFIMLTLRSLWLERNARVFDGAIQTAAVVRNAICQEWALWLSCRRRGGLGRGVT